MSILQGGRIRVSQLAGFMEKRRPLIVDPAVPGKYLEKFDSLVRILGYNKQSLTDVDLSNNLYFVVTSLAALGESLTESELEVLRNNIEYKRLNRNYRVVDGQLDRDLYCTYYLFLILKLLDFITDISEPRLTWLFCFPCCCSDRDDLGRIRTLGDDGDGAELLPAEHTASDADDERESPPLRRNPIQNLLQSIRSLCNVFNGIVDLTFTVLVRNPEVASSISFGDDLIQIQLGPDFIIKTIANIYGAQEAFAPL